MAITLTIECPVCNALMGGRNRGIPAKGNAPAIVDGNFVRDPSQHVHYEDTVQTTCSNGHVFRFEVGIVAWRVRPA